MQLFDSHCHFDDAWFDEDEQVRGHLRDPYHRPTSSAQRGRTG